MNKKIAINDAITKIIKKVTKKHVSFEELDNFDKRSVLEYLEENNLDSKMFWKKWYNILVKSFFVETYSLEPDIIEKIKTGAKNTGLSESQFIAACIEFFFYKNKTCKNIEEVLPSL